MNKKYKVCAVVVTYNPSLNFSESLYGLVCQVDYVVVVDNGSINIDFVCQHYEISKKIHILSLCDNYGVAYAFNRGVEFAVAKGCDWVLTLDQDSIVSSMMVESMFTVYEKRVDLQRIGLIAPRYRDVNTGVLAGISYVIRDDPELKCRQVLSVISSGSLIKLCVFKDIGFYNESFFIDYVDIEYCLRMNFFGYRILQLDNVVLGHAIGNSMAFNFFGCDSITSNHVPIRRYYFFRNCLATTVSYYKIFPLWCFLNFITAIKIAVAMVLREKDKSKKFIAMCFGILDYLQGRMGRCSRRL